MKPNLILTLTSLLSILLLTLHFTDDIVHGMEPGTLSNVAAVPILVVLLYGTLMLRQRRSGYIIMLIGGLCALGMPLIHMRGAGVGEIAKASGGFFFVWTLLALGVTGLFSIILSAHGLWDLQRSKSE